MTSAADSARACPFATLGAGFDSACGITTGAVTYCWGDNSDGQLGNGTDLRHLSPAAITGNVPFTAINAGDDHYCALAAGGAAYCWGYGGFGQAGDGSMAFQRTTPVLVANRRAFAR